MTMNNVKPHPLPSSFSSSSSSSRIFSVGVRLLNRLGIFIVALALSLHLLQGPTLTQPGGGVVTLEGSWTAKLSPCGGSDNDNTSSLHQNNINNPNEDLYPANGLCSYLAYKNNGNHHHTSPSAASLLSQGASRWWTQHQDDILNASHFVALDPNFVHKQWMYPLLSTLTPSMLQQGVRSRPLPTAVQALADLVHQRLKNTTATRPIQIAVVGGSVTQGRGCEAVQTPGYTPVKSAQCAWPSQLNNWINRIAGMELVQVHNLAIGGTGLAMASPLVKYWLYPPFLLPDGPDVIISAYATNEQFTYPGRIDTTKSTDFADLRREVVQDFIQAVQNSRPCDARPPLVIFLDDYIGNQQDRIIGETQYNKVVTELADWYGNVLHVSYADAVKRMVYGNTDQALFTAPWPRDKYGQAGTEVHFGMVGHVTISWVLGFAMLDTLVSYCDNEAFGKVMANRTRLVDESVRNRVQNVPPPPLTKETKLTHISQQWKQQEETRLKNQQENCGDPDFSKPPCAFGFLAGPSGTLRRPRQMRSHMQQVVRANRGWDAVDDYYAGGFARKLGWVATGANSTFTMVMANLAKEVRVINLQTLKSYGEKWANSTALFTMTVTNPGQEQVTKYFQIEGFHDSQTR